MDDMERREEAKKKGAMAALWPDVSTEKGAREAAKVGAGVSAFIGVSTAAVALFSTYVSPVLGLDLWSLVDAVLFGAIAFGIWKMSRVAAICGLALYLLEQWQLLTTSDVGPNGALIALFALFFVTGIRGTIAFSRIARTASGEPTTED